MDRTDPLWTGFLEKMTEAVMLGEPGSEVRDTLVNRRPTRYPTLEEVQEIEAAHRRWKLHQITDAVYCQIVVQMLRNLSEEGKGSPLQKLLGSMIETLREEDSGEVVASRGQLLGAKAVVTVVEHLQRAGIFLKEEQMVREERTGNENWIHVFCLCGNSLYRMHVPPSDSDQMEQSGYCPQCHLEYTVMAVKREAPPMSNRRPTLRMERGSPWLN